MISAMHTCMCVYIFMSFGLSVTNVNIGKISLTLPQFLNFKLKT